MENWIERDGALARMGVRQQTLYAYVSRGRIGVRPDPTDPRRSLYNLNDIENLRVRRSRGRGRAAVANSTMAWGEPSLETAISTVYQGRLVYRGQDAVSLAQSATWEEAAELLWQSGRPIVLAALEGVPSDPFTALAALVSNGYPSPGRQVDKLLADGEAAISRLAVALGAAPINAPLHERLMRGWSLPGAAAEPLRRALVLLADHELNASTFAVRVAASTGAPIAACMMAGLSALIGPRHGGAGAAAITLLDDARMRGSELAIRQTLSAQRYVPGFGHNLYPTGDPRAVALFSAMPPDLFVDELCEKVSEVCGLRPNIDFALAVLTRWSGMPVDAPFRLFALARTCGWIAHAMEQIGEGTLIRPRAHYTGELPEYPRSD